MVACHYRMSGDPADKTRARARATASDRACTARSLVQVLTFFRKTFAMLREVQDADRRRRSPACSAPAPAGRSAVKYGATFARSRIDTPAVAVDVRAHRVAVQRSGSWPVATAASCACRCSRRRRCPSSHGIAEQRRCPGGSRRGVARAVGVRLRSGSRRTGSCRRRRDAVAVVGRLHAVRRSTSCSRTPSSRCSRPTPCRRTARSADRSSRRSCRCRAAGGAGSTNGTKARRVFLHEKLIQPMFSPQRVAATGRRGRCSCTP